MHQKTSSVKFYLEELWVIPLKKFYYQWWVKIFEYSNKMTLEYYSDSYSCYFRSTNIFGNLLGKYVAPEYIRIFIRYILWHPNIFGYSLVSISWYSLITVWGYIWICMRRIFQKEPPSTGYILVLLSPKHPIWRFFW